MIEREIGNRGSKSVKGFNILTSQSAKKPGTVKEQRVDGSWHINLCLRCTLISFKRNHTVNTLSKKQIKSKCYYSTDTTKTSPLPTYTGSCVINPWFVTGFTDAEGSFIIQVRKRNNHWYCGVSFAISLHKKDLALLKLIQAYFGGIGSIYIHGKDSYQYVISSAEQITTKVLPHFDNYPLITKKYSDYRLFKVAITLMNSEKQDRTTDRGAAREVFIEKIVAIRASLNRGWTSVLKASFPNIVPVTRPSVVNNQVPHPQWIAGFTSGEGCFIIKTSVNRKSKLGYGVQLLFQITQDGRDELLMGSLVTYFGCGRVVKNVEHNLNKVNFHVTKFSDIRDKIIPFFRQHNILGEKLYNFEDWCRAGEIIKNKEHLTKEGLDQIFKIKAGTNKGRSFS